MSGQIEHIQSSTDGFCSFESPAAHEDGELAYYSSLFLREQVVTPINQGTQSLLARQGGATAAGQQMERIIQTSRDLFHPENLQSGGGELDRQGNPIQTPADLSDRCRV